MNRFRHIKDELPRVGEDILAISEDGDEHYVFLCKCGNEWRCSVTGFCLMIDVEKWKYIKEN